MMATTAFFFRWTLQQLAGSVESGKATCGVSVLAHLVLIATQRSDPLQLRRISGAIWPLSTTDERTIQDNLITWDGPVEKELESMRVLPARVTSWVANLPNQPASKRPQCTASSTVDLEAMATARRRNIGSFLSDA